MFLVAIGQVMSRMKLTWLGTPASNEEWRATQENLVFTIALTIAVNFLLIYVSYVHYTKGLFILLDYVLFFTVNIIFWLFSVFVTLRTRKHVRERYSISETFCLEDYVKTIMFLPWTVAQLGRHTVDYDQFYSYFFTLTGVASTVIWNDEKETDGSYDPPISQTPGNKSEADEDDGLVPIV